jgi:hypothetical protein
MKPTKTELKQNIKHALIREHGLGLIKFFGLDPNLVSPVDLCKKLRKLENEAHKITTQLCNGFPDLYAEVAEKVTKNLEDELDKIEQKVRDLLESYQRPRQFKKINAIFINGDPRGYALKLDTETIKYFEELGEDFPHKDWGGFGILAPDLSGDVEFQTKWIRSNWDELNNGTMSDYKTELQAKGYFVC